MRNQRLSGEQIAALMEARGVSTHDLQRKLKVSRKTAWCWLAGNRFPSREHQPHLAKLLGVSVSELNGWDS